jgi:hypothetical protein
MEEVTLWQVSSEDFGSSLPVSFHSHTSFACHRRYIISAIYSVVKEKFSISAYQLPIWIIF